MFWLCVKHYLSLRYRKKNKIVMAITKPQEDKDLFAYYWELPKDVQSIIFYYDELFETGEQCKYETCRQLAKELTLKGYEFEWGLDGIPFNLRKL